MEALKASEEKYRSIFSNSLVSIFTTDTETLKILEVNDKGVALFGYDSKEDFIENFNPETHFIDPRQRDLNISSLKDKGELTLTAFKMKKRDGSLFWVSVFSKLNPEQTRAYTAILDVTQQVNFSDALEQKVIERTLELKQSLNREKELNEMKSHFIGMVSHEFRTPLTTILSSASLLKSYIDVLKKDKGLKHINRITASVNHLTDILNDFLTLETLRKGVIAAESTEFEMPVFLTQIIEGLEGQLNSKKQHLKYRHHGDTKVCLPANIFNNIVLNLLTNAIKYSGQEKEIVLISSVDHARIALTVRDYGIGIPKEQQHKIFSEFFRADNVKNIDGTGLGLSIVSKYVALIGGTINFTSVLNEGSTFSVEIPHHYQNGP